MHAPHAIDLLQGAAAAAVVGHAVNSFPTPVNKYGAWFLGVVQFAVGQRIAGANTLQGKDTITAGISKEEQPKFVPVGSGTGTGN